MKHTLWLGFVIVLATLLASPVIAQPFTYQGFLKQNGQPVNGTRSMTFKLFTALTGGSQVGSTITQNVNVQNGLFTVELNFGAVWDGSDRYLEISVDGNTLSPRVKINPTPYASTAFFSQRPWQTSGSNIFYTAGNVGIGTSSPSVRLSLGGDNANTKLAIWDGGASGVMGFGVGPAQFRIHLPSSSNRFSFLDAPNGNEILTIQGNGDMRLANDRSIFGLDQLVGFNDLRLYGDATGGPDVYIAANGNVGIGTSSPSARLSLGGGVATNTKLAIWDGGASGSMGFGVGPSQFRIHLLSAGDRFSFLDAPDGNEIVTIRGIGNVGIGIISPQARLHVNSGDAFFTNNNTTLQVLPGNLLGQSRVGAATLEIPGDGTIGVWDNMTVSGTLRAYGNLHVGGNLLTLGGGTDPTWRRVYMSVPDRGGGAYVGFLEVLGANGHGNAKLSNLTDYPDHGAVTVHDSSGTERAKIYISSRGRGTLVAEDKFFREPDPDDPTRDIWYGCIEGPELAMYVRGTARLVNGRARIELPDHFRKLADEQGMTVQLTPLSPESKGLCVVRKGLDGIEVAELLKGQGNYEFDWEVKAVRKDHRDFRVYRPWDEALIAGDDPAQAWEARLKSIEARKARQQNPANP
ncbi:MAG: hypothetical protein N2045_08380 [Fimbriimonadales bacterium]|nr:hypothetical protein [Fimbriimonadales bacterium]